MKSIKSLIRSIQKRKYRKKSGEFQPEWYDRYASHNTYRVHYTKSKYYFLWTVIADRVVHSNINSVLDIGCGAGQLAVLLRDKGLKNYHGIDFSPKLIELAKQLDLEFKFTLADIFQTDLLETLQYDAIISTEFLEHIERDIDVIKRIKSGARCYVTVPNFPYSSHVRYFESSGEVYERYAKYFKEFRVDSFLEGEGGKKYFLSEGIKL